MSLVRAILLSCVVSIFVGCGLKLGPKAVAKLPDTLAEARKSFQTRLTRKETAKDPVEEPDANLFELVHYDSPAGKMAAYLSHDPRPGFKHPAIIWITGGDCNTIGDVWSPMPSKNDQSASAYRKAGIVMMFPSLRGGNENPGVKEGLFGEVDDVLAAADFLAAKPYVDPERIYLGGHSTGGTLVLLVAESSDRFRAVFSFGPVHDISGYGPEFMPFKARDDREIAVRSPGRWLHCIKSATYVFEGNMDGNLYCLDAMSAASKNDKVHFYTIKGGDHFTILDPVNRLIAARIHKDRGETCNLAFTEDELSRAVLVPTKRLVPSKPLRKQPPRRSNRNNPQRTRA